MVEIDDSGWTPGKKERLRHMWEVEKLPVSRIADRLNVTRNAVIGAAHRMMLTSRPSPIKMEGKPKSPLLDLPRDTYGSGGTHAGGAAMRGSTLELLGVVKPTPKVAPPPFAPSHAAVHGEINAGCRWPMWKHNEQPSQMFCGGDVVKPGKPYCAGHHDMAYVKLRDLRDATDRQADHLRGLHAKSAVRTGLTLWSVP